MAKSVEKGKESEREICRLFNGIVWDVRGGDTSQNWFLRNVHQAAHGGADILNPCGWSIEVKNHKSASVGAWWLQCVEQATRTGERPVLVWKHTFKTPWMARLYVFPARTAAAAAVGPGTLAVADMTLDAFCRILRFDVEQMYEKQKAGLDLGPYVVQNKVYARTAAPIQAGAGRGAAGADADLVVGDWK